MTSSELQAMVRAGELLPADLVWTKALSDWVPAERIAGLVPGSEAPAADEGRPHLAVTLQKVPIREALLLTLASLGLWAGRLLDRIGTESLNSVGKDARTFRFLLLLSLGFQAVTLGILAMQVAPHAAWTGTVIGLSLEGMSRQALLLAIGAWIGSFLCGGLALKIALNARRSLAEALGSGILRKRLHAQFVAWCLFQFQLALGFLMLWTTQHVSFVPVLFWVIRSAQLVELWGEHHELVSLQAEQRVARTSEQLLLPPTTGSA